MAEKRTSALLFIFITLLIDVIGIGIIIPVVPKLIQQMTGGSVSDASKYGGWLLFAYSIMQFLFSPVLGGLSDKYGRRPVLLASLFGFGVDYLLLGFAPNLAWLFVGRLIAGITGASFTTAGAYIADISKPEERAQNFGMIGAAFGVGFVIGPAVGGILGHYGPRVPFFVAAGLTLLNWLYGYFILPESLKEENRREFDWKRANPVGSLLQLQRYPIIISMVASFVCISLAGHATQSTWTYYTMEKFKWEEDWVGYSLSFVGLMVAIVQGGLNRILIPKLGSKLSVYIGLGFYVIGFTCFAFASEGWMMFAFMVPFALGGLAGPSLQGIMSGQVPPNEQGELQGALTGLISVTSIIGPLLMTYLFGYFTSSQAPVYFPGAPFIMGAVLTVLSIILAINPLSKIKDSIIFQDKSKEQPTH
ncbi:TCR/Tet family MFS transporter [Xanthocytophaga flava]|uniref:TCR/Tet family MFS transporter n=1 Tax=Xanthocytophaga flava TaxID=3048013 RepID=UPI0028D3AD89|nr:TCR/Tet family MFS transporter [Xanthocytophaga flavus]MDJ1468516.1 TCR/Tet family MFS transporter [Xanthocytophaga flavus]